MRQAINNNPVAQVAVLGGLAILVGLFFMMNMKGGSAPVPGSTAPSAASTATPSSPPRHWSRHGRTRIFQRLPGRPSDDQRQRQSRGARSRAWPAEARDLRLEEGGHGGAPRRPPGRDRRPPRPQLGGVPVERTGRLGLRDPGDPRRPVLTDHPGCWGSRRRRPWWSSGRRGSAGPCLRRRSPMGSGMPRG